MTSAATNNGIKPRRWGRRVLMAALTLSVILALLAVSLRVFVTTDAGARFIEGQINSRSFGPIESVQVTGLSGDPLRSFEIDRLEISDAAGVWFDANDLTLTWRPFALVRRHVSIESVAAGSVAIARRPQLEPTQSSDSSSSYRVTLDGFDFVDVALGESIMGQALTLEAQGELSAQTNGALDGVLNVERTDQPGDSVDVTFARSGTGTMSGEFQVDGAADGPIATLVRAPMGQAVSAEGTLSGTEREGQGEAVLIFGEQQAMTGELSWTAQDLEATLETDMAAWPNLTDVYQGTETILTSSLQMSRSADTPTFTANFNLPGLSLQASGSLAEEGWRPDSVLLDAKINRLSNFVTLPEALRVSQISVAGVASLTTPYRFNGRLETGPIQAQAGSTQAVSGPISVSQISDETLDFSTDITASGLRATNDLPIALGDGLRVRSNGRFDRETRRVTLQNYRLSSGGNLVQGQGQYAIPTGVARANGTARLNLVPSNSDFAGQLETSFSIQRGRNAILDIAGDGQYRLSNALEGAAGELIGDQLLFDLKSNIAGSRITLSEARLFGNQARLAVTGTIDEQIDIAGEALITEALTIGQVNFNQGGEVSFEASGSRSSPNVRLEARTPSLTVRDYVFETVVARADVTNIRNAPNGPVTVSAETTNGPLNASLNFASDRESIAARDIALDWGQLALSGDLSRQASGIVIGDIQTVLPEEAGRYARARLSAYDNAGQQAVSAQVDAQRIEWADWQFEQLKVDLDGDLDRLSGQIELQGRRFYRQIAYPFLGKIPVELTRNSDANEGAADWLLTLEPNAFIDGIEIAARGPTRLTYNPDTLSLTVPLRVEEGTFDLQYENAPDQEQLSVDFDDIRIGVLPLPGTLRETRGRMSANMTLSVSESQEPTGRATLSFTDWRGAGFDAGQGLSGRISSVIGDRLAESELSVESARGFSATGQIGVPLLSASSLAMMRPDMTTPLTGRVNASGSLRALLGLIAPEDAEVGGTLSAQVDVGGSLETLDLGGDARIRDMTFEIPEFGTRIRNGQADIQFTQNSVAVTGLSANDGGEGRITGQGAFELGPFGKPLGALSLQANGFEVLNRRDVEARVRGDLSYESLQDDATLSGTITIDTATVKEFIQGQTSVVSIPVEEINKPETLVSEVENRPEMVLNLDLNLRAPRRVFIRSRGLDLEMSANTRIVGTATDPEFYGEANIVRGGYTLAGQTLAISSGRMIFNGALSDARINMVATAQTQNLDVSVTISGTVEQPELELSSSPERPEDEILSAILFGRSVTELSAIEAAQLAGALAQLSGQGAGFDLLGGLRDAFGISQLSVNVQPDGSTRVVGGRYIAKDVYLQVFSGAGAQETGAIIDWTIRRNIALRSRINADNDTALSLKWRRDF